MPKTTDYPTKPVRVLIGFPPGQATDTLGRAVAARLSEQAWGQQFYVDNKPGAGRHHRDAGGDDVTPPDGYTLLVSSRARWP